MASPRLNVTDDILERVVFGMENQKVRLYLDSSDGMLKPETESGADRIPLPPWGPTEGYRLMERFAGSLPNAIFAGRLREILTSGSGVFRQFKDTLAERPEMEKLWRRFKMREMRRTALSWLSRWSEALDLENLDPEPEDWDDVPPTDFSVRRAESGEIPLIQRWDDAAQAETGPGGPAVEDANLLVAETPAGELVGFSGIVLETGEAGMEGRLMQVYVLPEFRGLGVGRMLTEAAFSLAMKEGAMGLGIDVGPSGRLLEPWLEREGFEVVATVWKKRL